VIGVADSRGFDFDQHFIATRFGNFNRFQGKLSFTIRNGCPGLHARQDNWILRKNNRRGLFSGKRERPDLQSLYAYKNPRGSKPLSETLTP
jgi:hypothetical protein